MLQGHLQLRLSLNPQKNECSGKGWFRKYGFVTALVLFVVLIVVFALLPVGSSSDMTPDPIESEESFEKAMNAFKHSKHPQVLVFNDKNATAHEQSERLKRTVAAHKQYWSDFESLNDLKLQFMHTLDWMLIEMFLQ